MSPRIQSDVEIRWLSETAPFGVETDPYEEFRVKGRQLLLVDSLGNEEVYVDGPGLFGTGPNRALILRRIGRPAEVVLVGQEGSDLLRLEIPRPSRIAEVPRDPNDFGGMCYVSVLSGAEVTLLHWELGLVALDDTFKVRWRQDLEWNHEIIHLDDREVWFDFHYDSEDGTEKIGVHPWGLSMSTGRELFDRTPPTTRVRPQPLSADG